MTKSIRDLCPDGKQLILPRALTGSVSINIAALGDVGSTLLMGLCLLGGEKISRVGIFDVDEAVIKRYEIEINQIGWPFCDEPGPQVIGVKESDLFDCDVFVFCASRAVPPLGAAGDVRMAQFEANRKIISDYARMAGERGFDGIFAVVSDPVDPLCKEVLLTSGLDPAQIRGYGLGVMNKRAEYFARRDSRFSPYMSEGRVFGPHGSDLVVANSLYEYDEDLSKELTRLTVNANMEVRDLGFKPYIAPALSSGAIPVLLTVSGKWHYSSVYFGHGKDGAFFGVRNRVDGRRIEIEDLPLPDELFERIRTAYENLRAIN